MTTWLEAFKQYEAVKDQHVKDARLMTPLEQQRAAEELRGIRQSLGPKIEAAAVQDLRNRFEDHANAEKRLRASIAGVQRMYDPARLAVELALAQREADRAPDVRTLQSMLDTAEDLHRTKAVAEVLASLKASGDQPDGAARNRLSKRAEAKLQELKYPSSVLDALEAKGEAMKGIVQTAHALTPVAIELDLPTLSREIMRVRTNREDVNAPPVTEILPEMTFARPVQDAATMRDRLFQSNSGRVETA